MKRLLLLFLLVPALSFGQRVLVGPAEKPTDLSGVAGIVVGYNMEASGATLPDISGNGNDGTITGATPSIWGLVFDGVDDYVDVNSQPLTTNTSFTVLLRFNLKSLPVTGYITDRIANTSELIHVYQEGDDIKFRVRGDNGVGISTVIIADVLQIDQWFDVVCVRDMVSDSLIIYLNGANRTTALDQTTSIIDPTLKIGNSQTLGYPLNGTIADTKIYNYAFTEAQAIAYHNSFEGKAITYDGRAMTYPGSGHNVVTDGTFNTACGVNWTCGSGWTTAGGKAVGTATTGMIYQDISLTIGKTYKITFTISAYSAGNIRPMCGSTTLGTYRSAAGTYSEILECTGNSYVYIDGGTAFTGKIDNVTVQEWTVK